MSEPTDAPPAPDAPPTEGEGEAFERLAEGKRPGFFTELWDFLRHNKKWWLLPILILIGVFGLLVFLAGTGLAPFLYPLF